MSEGPDQSDSAAPNPEDLSETEVETELQELIGELRVATTGVQVLFAFLLTVAFSARFETVSDFERNLYFAALVFSAVSSALLIAPTAYHRVNFGQHDKRHLLRVSNRLALAGLAALVLAVSCVLMVITDLIYSQLAGVIVAGVTAVFLTGLWLALPLSRRLTLARQDREAKVATRASRLASHEPGRRERARSISRASIRAGQPPDRIAFPLGPRPGDRSRLR